MKVKVRDEIYDGKDEPVMVVLSEGEKKQIAQMPGTKYCVYPAEEEWTADDYKKIKEWMNEGFKED